MPFVDGHEISNGGVMKKSGVMLAVVACVLLVIPGFMTGVLAESFIQNIGEGSVNWTKGVVQGKGIGAPPEKFYGKPNARPMAIRAAKIVALRNILETVNGIRVDSNTVVKDFAVQSDTIRSQVEGMVRGARQINVEYMSDGTVEVIMEISMYGDFARVLLPQEIMAFPMETPGAAPGGAPASGVLTGLVVDARGLGVRPAMAPKILDETGQEVYGSAFVSREFAVQQGMSGYAKGLDSAKQNQRVTANPLIVKGLRVEGPGQSNIVISNADAVRLRNSSADLSFLEKCRVMIVVD
jgi:hypothetical protein